MNFSFLSICRDFHKAAEVAFQDRNIAALEDVHSRCARNPDLADYVKGLKGKLGTR